MAIVPRLIVLISGSGSNLQALINAPQVAAGANGHTAAIYHDFPRDKAVSQKDFESLLGRSVPANEGPQKGQYTINTPLGDMQDSFIGRQLYSFIERQMAKMLAGEEDTPMGLLMQAMTHEMPLRAMLMMGDGQISREMLDALVTMMNGRTLRGGGALIKALRSRS